MSTLLLLAPKLRALLFYTLKFKDASFKKGALVRISFFAQCTGACHLLASSCHGSNFYIVWLRALCHFYFGFLGGVWGMGAKREPGGGQGGQAAVRASVGAAFVSSSSTHSCQIYFPAPFFFALYFSVILLITMLLPFFPVCVCVCVCG